MQKDWQEEEIKFLINNYEKMSYRNIGKTLERTQSSVENKAHKLGINRDSKYHFNIDFFKNPLNEYSSYWLGFIAADGYISNDYKDFGITLKKDDQEHLKKFNKQIEGNFPIQFRTRKEGSYMGKTFCEREQCSIRIYSKEVVSDLGMWNIIPRKSLVLEFPKIENDSLMWAYLRGYFDGDGSVYYDKNSNQLRAKITSGSKKFRESFCEYLNKFNIKTYISQKGEGYDCGITGKESTRIFLSNMYDFANIYLYRKYKKYQNYKYLFGFNKQ